MSRQYRVLEQDVALVFQHVPEIHIPRTVVGHGTCVHPFPQPRQELLAERAACLGDSSENVESFGIFTRKNVGIQEAPLVCESIGEVDHREVGEDLQEGLIWKCKDYSPH